MQQAVKDLASLILKLHWGFVDYSSFIHTLPIPQSIPGILWARGEVHPGQVANLETNNHACMSSCRRAGFNLQSSFCGLLQSFDNRPTSFMRLSPPAAPPCVLQLFVFPFAGGGTSDSVSRIPRGKGCMFTHSRQHHPIKVKVVNGSALHNDSSQPLDRLSASAQDYWSFYRLLT